MGRNTSIRADFRGGGKRAPGDDEQAMATRCPRAGFKAVLAENPNHGPYLRRCRQFAANPPEFREFRAYACGAHPGASCGPYS